MTVCPIAIVAGCARCPAFRVCPLKSVLGDVKKPDTPEPGTAKPESRTRRKAR